MSRVANARRAGAAAAAAPAAPSAAAPAMAPPAAPAVVETAAGEGLFQEGSLGAQSSSLSPIQTRNIVVDTALTATALSLGADVALSSNLPAVFAEGVQGVSNPCKCIITGIELQNVFSDCPSRVSVGANLFATAAQKQGLQNTAGWLYTSQASEMASEKSAHVSQSGEFTHLASLLPFEQSRHQNVSLYAPVYSSVNQRHLSDYGSISSKDELWKDIVAVTPTTYYVPQSSVVCRVISKNWDRFGFHPAQEELVEGGFYRIDKPIVTSVIDQLYENVIAKLPWTDLSNLKLHLQSNGLKPSNSNQHNVSMQLQVKYRYPMALPAADPQ